MADVHGTCDARFAELRDILGASLDSGADLGASVAVVLDGEAAVDLWGGWADEAHTRPWTEDTVTNVWSTTKTMVALSALLLVERALVDPFAPVARYWPEFAANGKEHVEVRHLMSHTSGVPAWEQPVTYADIYDWESSTARLAAQAPWWTPGEGSGYHALNYGHLIGEVIRRVDGRGLKQFVAEELAEPFGADFQIGLRDKDLSRVSDVVPPPPLPIDLDALGPELKENIALRTLTSPLIDAATANTAGWRHADIGGANGHSNARGVARIQSIVGNDGTIDGRKILSRDTLDLIWQEQSHGPDHVLFLPLRFGIGYGLPEPSTLPYIPEGEICFWGGYGGSMIVVDRGRRMTVAYMMNKMEAGIIGGLRSRAILESCYRSLG
ncbi:MAG: serine hydrolase domain-containing protein [Acidimicrobiia bacterium]